MKSPKRPTFVFDLDGVITKTEAHHFEAWKQTASFLDCNWSPDVPQPQQISKHKQHYKMLPSLPEERS